MSFYLDVITKSKAFRSTAICNDPAMLEPVTRQAVANIIAYLGQRGTKVIIGETYRSKDRQQKLFDQGASKLRDVGVHHYGLACDLWIVTNGKVDWKADYHVIGVPCRLNKLIWGNDWGTPNSPHSFRDIDHVQRVSLKKQPSLFAGVWYPKPDYNPLAD